MILPISEFSSKNLTFGDNKKDENNVDYTKDTLLKNNFSTRTRIGLDKFTKAFTVYPARGLKGSINSNFYEFLTMGTVPYVIGSVMLMSIFNSANKHFSAFAQSKASKLGNKMAMGVILYALFKEISKSFTNIPVRLATGIDTELPYAKVNYLLQENPDSTSDLTSIEYHKVGESVDFPRWDQLYGDPKKGEAANFRYDKIAKKNGLGDNLNDSDQEVKPIYKEVLVKSKLAKSFSSFMWAATGVALAFQKPWENYFRVATLKFWNGKEFLHSLRVLGESFVESAKELYKGSPESFSKLERHSGKIMIGSALLITVLGVLNTLHITHKPQKNNADKIMDRNKESVVD
ncbi:hypothetical protein IJ541_01380 [bacterium]|nr:hypothetical protein [bacterium]